MGTERDASKGLLTALAPIGPMLVVVAAPAEAAAVLGVDAPEPWSPKPLGEGADLVLAGVGKANAAGAAGSCLSSGAYRAVLQVGVAGALPGPGSPGVGDVVVGDRAVFGDEGVQTPEGFSDVAAMGFAPIEGERSVSLATDPALLERAAGFGDVVGGIATVSTCSGTDAAAAAIAARTGAVAEAMEGAAIAVVCRRLGVGFVEVRVVSNTTGDRSGQRWDLRGALDRLGALVGAR